jgi:hypothetical protein
MPMPMTSRFLGMTRIALLGWAGVGLLVVTACGPPEAGSVKLPENFKPSGPMSYGPAGLKGTAPSLGPGDFRPAPPPRAKSNPRGGRPAGATRR